MADLTKINGQNCLESPQEASGHLQIFFPKLKIHQLNLEAELYIIQCLFSPFLIVVRVYLRQALVSPNAAIGLYLGPYSLLCSPGGNSHATPEIRTWELSVYKYTSLPGVTSSPEDLVSTPGMTSRYLKLISPRRVLDLALPPILLPCHPPYFNKWHHPPTGKSSQNLQIMPDSTLSLTVTSNPATSTSQTHPTISPPFCFRLPAPDQVSTVSSETVLKALCFLHFYAGELQINGQQTTTWPLPSN